MTMITPSYLGETIEYSSLHACRSTLEDPTTEYNLALGDRRAQAAKDFLVSLGIAADRIQTVSYGKERPFCSAHDEACYKQNRRAHFVMAK